MKTILTPSIVVCEKSIEIVGEAEGLMALGELLILKAKLGRLLKSATLYDDINPPIHITIREDIINDDGSLVKEK